jgi:hypothetical protein
LEDAEKFIAHKNNKQRKESVQYLCNTIEQLKRNGVQTYATT